MESAGPTLTVTGVAAELTHVRWRGIADIDERTRSMKPVATPMLDELLRRHAGPEDGAQRAARLARLLRDVLAAYRRDGHRRVADFIEALFFDAPDQDRRTPTERKHAVQLAARLNDDAFDDRRRSYFVDFSAFLIEHVNQDDARGGGAAFTAEAPDTAKNATPWGRRVAWLVGAGVVVALLIVVIVVLGSRPSSDATSSSQTTAPALGNTAPMLRFNDLGGGSSIIRVWAGPGDSQSDRRVTGTFPHGESVAAICQVEGRTVTSDPSVGEQQRTSSTWVRIEATPGADQYAPLTYADIDPVVLADLPACG